jgi:hypothetical protein
MDMTADELQTYENVDRLSKVVISEHLVEISLHWEGFYDYIVFFDDYWYNQHPTLAKSLINFHEKAMLGKNQNKDY